MDELEWLSDYVVGFMKAPTWVVPIAQFVDDRCEIFDEEGSSEENKLEYTACHREFGALVSDLLTAHLLEVSVTAEMFERFCQQGLNENQELHRVLIEQLLAVDDFLTFKAMMLKHNAELYREAVVTLDTTDGGADEPLSPTREVASQVVNHALGLDEWRLYEDQLFQNEVGSSGEEGLEALRRCEEAELQHAIALSLQLEEERLRQTEGLDLVPPAPAAAFAAPPAPPASAGFSSASLCCYVPLSAQIREEEAAPPLPAGAGFRSMPLQPVLPHNVDSALAPAAQPDLPVTSHGIRPVAAGCFTSAPLMPLPHGPKEVPRLVRVEPLTLPPSRLAETPIANPQARALRERAERVLAPVRTGARSRQDCQLEPLPQPLAFDAQALGTLVPPAAPAPMPVPANVALAAATASAISAGGPSTEERRLRAEHLKNQRDRLLQKRRQGRDQQLVEAIAAKGRSSHVAAAVDRALQTSGPVGSGGRMLAELIPQAAAPPAQAQPNAAAAAEQMRHALTFQLKQNLARSASGGGPEALSDQLQRLEWLQAGGRS